MFSFVSIDKYIKLSLIEIKCKRWESKGINIKYEIRDKRDTVDFVGRQQQKLDLIVKFKTSCSLSFQLVTNAVFIHKSLHKV